MGFNYNIFHGYEKSKDVCISIQKFDVHLCFIIIM